MDKIGCVETLSRKKLFKVGVWASLLIASTGCPPHSPGPEVFDPGDTVKPPAADLGMSLVEPSLAVSGSADRRPQLADPTVEELDRQAHGEGLLVDIYFDFDRSELTAMARADLERNARYLHRSSSLRLLIEGHCDERGTNEYNLALGHLRARTARDYLIRLGIAAERLDSISYGEERGVCQASSERCWARNRRAYLRIVGRGRSSEN